MSENKQYDLIDVAKKINLVVNFVNDNITPDEVDAFIDHCIHQETVMPLFNPTSYMKGGSDLIKLARARGDALRAFFEEIRV